MTLDKTSGPDTSRTTDAGKHEFEFGEGGVPWYLLAFYLAFLVFFTWYVTEFQLKDFEQQGPISVNAPAEAEGGAEAAAGGTGGDQ